MSTLSEEKVFRDPIHGYVRVQDKVVWDCIQTREFQRLEEKTIRFYLNGLSYFRAYRFAHSLGVYEIARRMINEVEDISRTLTEYEK